MDCPKCGAKRIPTKQTVPADNRTDGRVARMRTCRECSAHLHTMEIPTHELRALEQGLANIDPTTGAGTPLPMLPAGRLLDIEGELEGLLQPSIDALAEVLTSGEDLPKEKVATARWLVADRREYRKALAECEGASESEDPAIAELAKVLHLVKPESTGTDG